MRDPEWWAHWTSIQGKMLFITLPDKICELRKKMDNEDYCYFMLVLGRKICELFSLFLHRGLCKEKFILFCVQRRYIYFICRS